MAARTRAVVALIFITMLVMLSSYSVQALTDFEGRKIARMRSAYEHTQRRSEIEVGKVEAVAEPTRRPEQAPPSPTANVNFPGPDSSPGTNK